MGFGENHVTGMNEGKLVKNVEVIERKDVIECSGKFAFLDEGAIHGVGEVEEN